MCRIKPVILVSELVDDIEDPNVLDKIDNKELSNFKSCLCDSPGISCNYCSNKKEQKTKNFDTSTLNKNFYSKIFFIIRYGLYTK